jgi:hypothetical protein
MIDGTRILLMKRMGTDFGLRPRWGFAMVFPSTHRKPQSPQGFPFVSLAVSLKVFANLRASVSWWLKKTQQQLGLPFAVSYTSAAIRFIRVPSLDAPPFQLIN